MMHFLHCVLMLIFVISDDTLGFSVRGPSGPLVVPLGGSVILPCYVETPLAAEKVKVVWKRTDSETLVHLFLDGESRPEAQQQDYHDRAHFFTDQIQHGNFSLRLENVRAEDRGVYRCKVYSQQLADKTLVEIKDVERLIVSGSGESVSAYDGEDVTLSCSVDSHIPIEDIEVSWIRTDGDIPVLLFQNNETLSDAAEEQYRDRVEFFTAEIPKGNFSLRLKSVRTEDKGVYMCLVFAGDLSANATAELEQLGFSSWHIAVLFFCFAAGSGAVLLLCCLIYYRSKNTVNSSIIWNLQVSLVFYPNICMFFAFMLWGFTEGSLHETVPCCALYILRPVMLIWALHYLKNLQDNHKLFFRITHELAVLTVIVYSVLFAYGWRISAHDTNYGRRIASGIFFGCVVLFCLILSGAMILSSVMRTEMVDKIKRLSVLCMLPLSFFQLLQMVSSFGLSSPVFLIVPFVQPPLPFCIPLLTRLQARFKFLLRRWIKNLYIIIITLPDIILVIYANLTILEREKEYLEWTCVILFIEVLKITVVVENCVLKRMLKDLTGAERIRVQRRRQQQQQQTELSQQGSNTSSLCSEIMFMFGAVGLVLLNSVTLTAELILKARNGERVMKDMRVIVFPSECVFVLYWMILQMHAYLRIVTTGSTHNQRNSHQRGQLMNTPENREMENLSAADPDVSQIKT